MTKIKGLLLGCVLSAIATSANAGTIDFIDLANNVLGESGYSTLTVDAMSVTGDKGGVDAFAYLDYDKEQDGGGLGVCGRVSPTGAMPGNTSNQCDSGASDDNVTVSEVLTFTFNQDVEITNIWFNNNHDGGFVDGSEIDIEGLLYTAVYGVVGDANAYSTWTVLAGETFTVSYNAAAANTDLQAASQFYVSGMSFRTIPEPTILGLLALGLIGIGASQRRKV